MAYDLPPKRTTRPFVGFDASTVSLGSMLSPTVIKAYKRDEYTSKPEMVAAAVAALQTGTFGRTLVKPAHCQLCSAPIGRSMRTNGRFEWLDGSEHYVTEHKLWPPGLSALIELATTAASRAAL